MFFWYSPLWASDTLDFRHGFPPSIHRINRDILQTLLLLWPGLGAHGPAPGVVTPLAPVSWCPSLLIMQCVVFVSPPVPAHYQLLGPRLESQETGFSSGPARRPVQGSALITARRHKETTRGWKGGPGGWLHLQCEYYQHKMWLGCQYEAQYWPPCHHVCCHKPVITPGALWWTLVKKTGLMWNQCSINSN